MFEKIKKWYQQGLWTLTVVQDAEVKGFLTSAQVIEILASK